MKLLQRLTIAALLVGVGLLIFFLARSDAVSDRVGAETVPVAPEVTSTSSPHASAKAKRARWEYFQRMLRDPATGRIPSNIRARELAYARTLPTRSPAPALPAARAQAPVFDWFHVGPNDVGGRTRALAVDVENPDVIIAGGVSGGMWKSTDGGASWSLKSTSTQVLSVTSVVQDPRPGHHDTWYYASGEFRGNSASAPSASFRGGGIYKSTDNGDNWTLIADAGDPTAFDTPLDYISRIVVNPRTGSVFIASNAIGIYRSTDGGQTWNLVLGGVNDHVWSDVVAASDGTLLATLSEASFQSPANAPGVYISTDDGDTWTNITPNSFPTEHWRSRIAFAPSAPDTAYILTASGNFDCAALVEDVRLHFFELSGADTVQTADRSANLPEFGDLGNFCTQTNYNMAIAVKPDDPDFVIVGGRNLYRSDDGFTTTIDSQTDWIGGYGKPGGGNFVYPDHHPDQHALAFDPDNPDQLWSGHDGGLSFTTDVTTSNGVSWVDKNNGYNVTQFYTVALPDEAGDNRIAGGTQDNGTPYFRTSTSGGSTDISSGDGAHVYFADDHVYTSSQLGRVLRLGYNASGDPVLFGPGSTYEGRIDPQGASGQLFINPFAVDPGNEEVMFYPAGASLWRTDSLSSVTRSNGWTELTSLPDLTGCTISSLAISRSNPAHVLYYGAYCGSTAAPRLFRMENAEMAATATEISISGIAAGAYIHDIAVNPEDGDELLAVFSNYNVVGLYRSTDGGQSWTAVEGNLKGTASTPGPSLRAATILPTPQKDGYLVATSTGVYSTTAFDGSSTTWELEAANTIGNAVVEDITSRTSDGRVAAAAHGRGIFISDNNALPINLVSFTAVADDGTVTLKWITASEVNSTGFEVQFKSPTSDTFEKLAFVESKGTASGPRTYTYRVEHLHPGRYVFRLKQIDGDGPPTFSDTVDARLSLEGRFYLSGVYPNPFARDAKLDVMVREPQEVTVAVYDVLGRRVQVIFEGELEPGTRRTLHLDGAQLASGLYVVRIQGETFTASTRAVRVR